MLTKIQYELLRIIRDYQKKYQNFPAIKELAAAFKYSSRTGLYPTLALLEKQGYLKKIYNGAYVISKSNWENEPIKPAVEEDCITSAQSYYKNKYGV